MEEEKSHIILFPFLAHGHINPFVSLASLLHHRNSNLTITFVSTPRHIQSVSSLPFSSSIRFHSLPFSPESHGLPPNTESLADLQLSQFVTFFYATRSLQPAFDISFHPLPLMPLLMAPK
ncbi:hypothetical protein LUZ61_020484 [Rhynchospora tenuis]|uniref:Uncharacterized protein n=1 Tax=Rhynchospora tenuis TaxID=198213 RepID=A0AAD6ENT8_9POAL|nr:hypothetical protein LUZ61_020484 [Rhynchospora tenuis]